VDPERMSEQAAALAPLAATLMSRTESNSLRWTICQFPTEAAAQDANMSLRSYEDFVYNACLLQGDDPVAAWREVSERQQRLVDWLAGKEEIHLIGPNIDLTVNVRGRTWLNDDGHLNFPGGEIFTGPNEDSAEGSVTFSFPAFFAGREVSGVHLEYRSGRVVEASATADERYLLEMLDLDDGARRMGEFAFGTNAGVERFSKNTLFDEKIGGTLHMALGRSIPMTGGQNESALHWDMVFDLRDGTEVLVDGELFSRNGVFQV
jgi:aminopeptidase